MDCATAREAISAVIDGEDPETDLSAVDAHLTGCADCHRWRDAAHEVTRRARVTVVATGLPRSREVAAAVGVPGGGRWRGRMVVLARLGLVVVAAGQLALTVPSLLFGHDHSAPVHVAHELGAFDAALAAGFLVAAWRPSRALGMQTLVGVASALLIVTAVADLTANLTTADDEAPHLLAVAGWLLICYLAARTPPSAPVQRPGRGGLLPPGRRSLASRANQPTSTTADEAQRPSAHSAAAATGSAPGAVSAAEPGVDAAIPPGLVAGRMMPAEVTAHPEDAA